MKHNLPILPISSPRNYFQGKAIAWAPGAMPQRVILVASSASASPTLVSSGDEETVISNMSGQFDCPAVETHTAEPTLPYLIDKVTDIAVANQDAGLLIAGAIGTSAVLYVVADAAAKLIKVLRSSNQA